MRSANTASCPSVSHADIALRTREFPCATRAELPATRPSIRREAALVMRRPPARAPRRLTHADTPELIDLCIHAQPCSRCAIPLRTWSFDVVHTQWKFEREEHVGCGACCTCSALRGCSSFASMLCGLHCIWVRVVPRSVS